MPAITDAQVAQAQTLLDTGKATSIRKAASLVDVSESGLRYRLNGQRRASGRGTPDPIRDPDEDQLPDAPTAGLPVIQRPYPGVDALRVYPLGDVHVGSKAHEAEKWQEWLDYLRGQDDVSIILTGDLLNSALKNSKSESYDETMTVDSAMDQIADQLAPVKDKIDLMIPGNHEERIYRAVGIEPIRRIARELGVPYARKVALLRHQFDGAEYVTYVRHGTGDGGGSLGSRVSSMERAAKAVVADIYLSAHTHSQVLGRDRVFEVTGDKPDGYWRRRLFLSGGSFVGYEDYAAERAYVAGDVGAPRLRLDGARKDAHASI